MEQELCQEDSRSPFRLVTSVQRLLVSSLKLNPLVTARIADHRCFKDGVAFHFALVSGNGNDIIRLLLPAGVQLSCYWVTRLSSM
jgi:hypothetical protein